MLEVAIAAAVGLGGVQAELARGGGNGERGTDVGGQLRLGVFRDVGAGDVYIAHVGLRGGVPG